MLGCLQIFNKLTLKRLSVFSGIFEAHLEEIVNAGFDVNVVAASMSVDSIRHLHSPNLRARGTSLDELNLKHGETNFHLLVPNILGWKSCHVS